MNTEIKQQWIDELRGDTYKQGMGMLRSARDEYCCLGVLCDIVDPLKWVEDGDCYKFEGDTAMLDNTILSFVGLDEGLMLDLVEMNDRDFSFAELADIIEEKA